MKTTIIYQRDSHFKATRSLRVAFLHAGFEINEYFYEALENSFYLEETLYSDVVIISCGGRAINSIINKIKIHHKAVGKRPLVITNFPGIVVDSQLEAFITRLRSDLVLLNSNKDIAIYKKICRVFNRPFNGILAGALWFTTPASKYHRPNKKITVFYEQEQVPKKWSDRVELVKALINLANTHSDRCFYIKNRGEGIKSNSIFSLVNDLVKEIPENLMLFNGSVDEALLQSNSCITVSSSVALEALLLEQNVFLANIGGLSENHLGFFKGSGLLVRPFEINIEKDVFVHKKWIRQNLTDPTDKIATIVENSVELIKYDLEELFSFKRNKKVMLFKLFYNFPLVFINNYPLLKKKIYSACYIIQGKKNV